MVGRTIVGFSTWHEANFFNSENYIIGQLGGARVRRKRSRWMIESRARVGNFIVLLEPSDRGLSTLRINGRHSFDPSDFRRSVTTGRVICILGGCKNRWNFKYKLLLLVQLIIRINKFCYNSLG